MTSSSAAGTTPRILGPEHRKLTLGIVATVVFIAFEAMAVATAMPKAVPDLDGVALYALAFSGFFTTSLLGMVIAGETCDRRGPRLPIIAGALAFTIGLLLAGAAQSMWPFIAGRAAQGLGGGLVVVALYVVVGRSYPESMRPRIFAAMSAAWVVPSIVGPLVAGLLADHASWRWVFLGLAPFVLLPVLAIMPSVRAVDGPPPSGPVIRRRRMPLALATATGMGILQYAGTRPDLVALALVVVGLALVVPSVPRLLPPGTLRVRRGLPTVVLMRGILAGSFFGAEAFLPLLLVAERGLSSTLAGLSLTGAALGWAAGSWYQGRPRTVVPRYLLVRFGSAGVSMAIALLGLVLLPAIPALIAALIWMFGAFGMGMAMSSISVLLFQVSPVEEHGTNSAAMQLSDALFSIAFVGLAGTIFGSSHGAEATTGTSVPMWVYAVILAVMSALAGFGAWAAGRLNVPAPEPVVPEAADDAGPARHVGP
ncbi:MFS transporter [Phytoactinopolyspora alkaliphila]|uniref:MFS transporter n=1 Tax=Phytoactinopolyspora alkaliphila TaxID=1783498 RepID=A0A6N9YMI1_9ACTN|nr:MFS transporter [Phytoactinopolyspora alkaliphila]NED96155.1 MFS transporter [Phytoactinopolyspora alkaliphila]